MIGLKSKWADNQKTPFKDKFKKPITNGGMVNLIVKEPTGNADHFREVTDLLLHMVLISSNFFCSFLAHFFSLFSLLL